MKTAFFVTAVLFTSALFAQRQDTTGIRKISDKVSIASFVDSLKTSLYKDTIRFNRSDLHHDLTGTRNINPYAPIFIINNRYAYVLDIVSGKEVDDFIKNILIPENILYIHFVQDTFHSQSLFAYYGIKGAISIRIKKHRKIIFFVAGLAHYKNSGFNNYYQRKKGELLIHD